MHTALQQTIDTEVQGRVEDYGDLVVQNIRTEIQIPAANLPNALPFYGIEVAEHDVMGGVDRYGAEEGVLLSQKLRSLTAALQGTYTNEANVFFRYTFGFGADLSDEERDSNVDEGFGSAADRFVSNEVNNDALYHVNGKATAGYEDTGVGTGAGPESHIVEDETNYLNEIGVLPEVSLRETLSERLSVGSRSAQDPEDGTFRLYTAWQLYWLETDDDIEGRQVDLFED